MGTVQFRRPPRRPPPPEPRGEIVLESPPDLPETSGGGGAGQTLTYLPMVAGAGSTALLVTGSGGGPITYLGSGMMALSMGGMAMGSMGRQSGQRRGRLDADRRDYQRYLGQVRRRVREAASQQRTAALWHHPEPSGLWCSAIGTRLWERRSNDGDFLAVRIGRGNTKLGVTLVTPETKPVEDLEPISAGSLRRFVRTHSTLADIPVAVALPAFARISFDGSQEDVRSLARAMLAQLATFHSPDDLVIAVCGSSDSMAEWDWVKWLPHALKSDGYDAAGQIRLFADDLVRLEAMFGDTLTNRARFGASDAIDGPHIIVVLDRGRPSAEAQLANGLIKGVTVLDLDSALGREPGAGVLNLEVRDGLLAMHRRAPDGGITRTDLGRADRLSHPETETLARIMAPLRMSAGAADAVDALSTTMTLPELLHLGDPFAVDTEITWRPRAPRDRLRVPIGVGANGQAVDLDIKESAQGGMGPHGLCIGATGSGKSELLRTLVLGLALTHSSETLNFVLVDFKGGATFASLDVLPHTSAVITNLANELTLVDRMKDSLQGEMVRRQEALRAAGNYASLRDYEKAREQGAELEPMPSLFIVVDEFSELLTAKPDFIDLFVMIGRLGRSLGVHLLLASQRLEEGRLRGLDTHLSYRIGLRTFSAMESRVVLGVPDAYELPSAPGNGYLKESTEDLLRFKAAYVSGPYVGAATTTAGAIAGTGGSALPYVLDYLPPAAEPVPAVPVADTTAADAGPADSMMDILVDRLKGRGTPARQVWLPPLGAPPTLDQLFPPLTDTERGVQPSNWERAPVLTIPVGIVDKPFEQRRDPLWYDLSTSHFVVAGGPQSGKSTVFRTMIMSLALCHTPEQVQVYCLDFGGGTLTGLSELPHVGSVSTRLETDRIRRTIAEITTMLDAREVMFTENRVDSMASYRRMVASGAAPKDGYGDVFLVVDGWGALRQNHEDLEAQITQLASRGLSFGVHVVLSIQRWMELRPALRDLIGTRLELRLGDPSESEIDRRVAVNIPDRSPGRGINGDKLHILSALPRIDGKQNVEDLVDGVAAAVARVRAAWSGPAARGVRLLPDDLPFASLPAIDMTRSAIPIGVDEEALATVEIDFESEPHFLVIGDVESGKSNMLRMVARGITTRWTPEEAKVITFDYRRGLLGAITTPHQLSYVMNSAGAAEVASSIVSAMRERLAGIKLDPTAMVMPQWTGSRLFVIVDDYDLLAAGSGNPLAAIAEFLPQARDIGLHVVVSRASAGCSQGMFEPVLRRLKEMATPGVLLSGSKDEGVVLGASKMEPFPPGRGRLVHRKFGAKLVQTARFS